MSVTPFRRGLVETPSGLVVPAEAVEAPKPEPKPPRRPIQVGDVFVLDGIPFKVRKVTTRDLVLRVPTEVRTTTVRNMEVDK